MMPASLADPPGFMKGSIHEAAFVYDPHVRPPRLVLLSFLGWFVLSCGPSEEAPPLPDAPRCELARPSPAKTILTPEGTRLRDDLGRVVFLRGVNAGGRSKFAPFVPFDFPADGFDQALAQYLDRAASWGISVLRVPFAWAAVEPTKGVDDQAFLARYDALLDAAWQRGMYTIVDFHQDIYSEVYCGDGFPAWTIAGTTPAPHHDCADWFVHYSQDEDVRAAFNAFWSDTNGARTDFRALWSRMAARYANRPGVIGFEPLNEPHQGSAEPNAWASTVLTDFYGEMASVIHEKAPDALVFFDSTGQDAIGAATALKKPTGEKLVFAPHWYDPAALFGGTPAASNAAEGIGKWGAKAQEWQVPVLVGESGVRPDLDVASEFVSAIYDAMDANGLHFTYWEYSDSKDSWNSEDFSLVGYDGVEAKAVTDSLARPYPRAVAGENVSFAYEAASRTFSLAYDAPASADITEIAVPSRVYPAGFRVELSSGCVDEGEEGLLLVRPSGGSRVSVTIHPK